MIDLIVDERSNEFLFKIGRSDIMTWIVQIMIQFVIPFYAQMHVAHSSITGEMKFPAFNKIKGCLRVKNNANERLRQINKLSDSEKLISELYNIPSLIASLRCHEPDVRKEK